MPETEGADAGPAASEKTVRGRLRMFVLERTAISPMTAVEIAALISELVEIDEMGVNDDFFRVGGKSWERW